MKQRAFALLCVLLVACSPFHASPPHAFAPFRKGDGFRAVSPDGVTFTVRDEDNDPRADLDFWREAMAVHLAKAGYKKIAEGDLLAKGRTGHYLELAAPFGTEDYSYLVAVFVAGKHLIVAEAGGPTTIFATHRSAILDAVAALAIK